MKSSSPPGNKLLTKLEAEAEVEKDLAAVRRVKPTYQIEGLQKL
jgi:hypothetical protein